MADEVPISATVQPQQQQQQQLHQQQQEQQTPLSARAGLDSARSVRAASRMTLQPFVHDFNGNIINRAVGEWT
jgi:hypothetical protein